MLAFDGGRNHRVVASLKPASKGTLDQPWDDVCKQLDSLMATYGLNKANVVKQLVFLSGTEANESSRQRLHRYDGAVGPSTSFVFHPPADGENIAMEVLVIQGEQVKVEWVTPNLTIVSDSVCRGACVAGIEPQLGLPDSYDQVLSCFRQMRRLLEGAGFHFNQVVRTWLFERDISIRQDYHLLLLSGTASIKGQETVHPGDPTAQARTTLENTDLVLRQADASLKNVQQLPAYIKHSPDKQEQAARVDVIKKIVDSVDPVYRSSPDASRPGAECRDMGIPGRRVFGGLN